MSALLLVASGWVLVVATGLVPASTIPDAHMQSATFTVTAFLGAYFLCLLLRRSLWERMLSAPIILGGALLAGWLTFG